MENFIFCAMHDKMDAYVTVNVIKLVIMHISRLLCIIYSPLGKSDEKRKFLSNFPVILHNINVQWRILISDRLFITIASKYV